MSCHSEYHRSCYGDCGGQLSRGHVTGNTIDHPMVFGAVRYTEIMLLEIPQIIPWYLGWSNTQREHHWEFHRSSHGIWGGQLPKDNTTRNSTDHPMVFTVVKYSKTTPPGIPGTIPWHLGWSITQRECHQEHYRLSHDNKIGI
jgi:hypothetical protein